MGFSLYGPTVLFLWGVFTVLYAIGWVVRWLTCRDPPATKGPRRIPPHPRGPLPLGARIPPAGGNRRRGPSGWSPLCRERGWPADILRFYGEDKEVRAQTAAGVYTVRFRLYELEERLPKGQFVRVSHSEIVNLARPDLFDQRSLERDIRFRKMALAIRGRLWQNREKRRCLYENLHKGKIRPASAFAAAFTAVFILPQAGHRREASLRQAQDAAHRILLRRLGQAVAPSGSTRISTSIVQTLP